MVNIYCICFTIYVCSRTKLLLINTIYICRYDFFTFSLTKWFEAFVLKISLVMILCLHLACIIFRHLFNLRSVLSLLILAISQVTIWRVWRLVACWRIGHKQYCNSMTNFAANGGTAASWHWGNARALMIMTFFLLANLVFCPPDIQSQIIYIIRLFLQKHIIIL
jgi:hypothetical protein